MDEYTYDQVLRWYERMENAILEYSNLVPLVPDNEGLESPFLVSCLIDACGLLDSLFRDLVDDSQPVNGKIKKKTDYDIQDFAECFSARFNLPNMRSILLQAPPRYLIPFFLWSRKTGAHYSRLTWWNAYTHLKHDRLTAIKEGTLGATINALCGLHQVLARFPKPEMVKLLIRQDWLKLYGWNPEIILKEVEDHGGPQAKFIVQTKLFAVPIGLSTTRNGADSMEFETDIQNLKLFQYQNSYELSKFFGRL